MAFSANDKEKKDKAWKEFKVNFKKHYKNDKEDGNR
jgi:hypothetical protein